MKCIFFFILFLFLSLRGDLLPGDENQAWPEMGPLPKGIDKRQYTRYGQTVQLFSPVQRKALWDARVRRDHPRLYINKNTLPAIREKMKTHPAFAPLQKKAEAGDHLACAFVFQMTGNKKYANKALELYADSSWLASKQRNLHLLALIFDWCFTAIPMEDMEEYTKKLASVGLAMDSKTDKGANGQAKYLPKKMGDGRGASVGPIHAYIALAHHWPGAHVDAMNFYHPDYSPMAEQLARCTYGVDGSIFLWYTRRTLRNSKTQRNFFILESSTGIPLSDESKSGKSFFKFNLQFD